MNCLVDYFRWPDEFRRQEAFRHTMFESLQPYPEEVFIRQMNIKFPGFSDYVMPNPLGFSLGSIVANPAVFKLTTREELEKQANALSYRIASPESYKGLIFKPDKIPSDLPADSKYVHISPVPELHVNGIRCKSSGKFEEYDKRIYLMPVSEMVIPGSSQEDMYTQVIEQSRRLAHRFNNKYLETGKIEDRESYYIYLVDLPEKYSLYEDDALEGSVYVINSIPHHFVEEIGYLEKP